MNSNTKRNRIWAAKCGRRIYFLTFDAPTWAESKRQKESKPLGPHWETIYKVKIRGKVYLVHRVVAQTFHWDVVKELYHASDFAGDIMAFLEDAYVDHFQF